MVSRYDDPRWYEEQDHTTQDTQHPEFEDFNQQPSLHMPAINNPAHTENTPTQALPRPPRLHIRKMAGKALTILALMIVAFIGGWFSHQYFGSTLTESDQSRAYSQLFQQAWNTIDQNYVDRKDINYKQMAYAAINAMVATLHDTGHTRFLTPAEVQSENQQLSGKFTGIGIYLHQDPQTKQIIINSPIPGAPAEKAGLKHGDVIIAVNGTSVVGKDLTAVSALIAGKAGTSVNITVQRPGVAKPLTFTITRAQIQVPNVLLHYIPQSHIAQIQIVQFADGVTSQLKDEINQAKRMGATKIVLDLRDNPGGYLNEAIDTVSLFQKSGNVLLVQDSSGHRSPMPVNGNAIDTNMPIVVLVNGNTASAAEITAGALMENHRATVIGEKTFGTGTVLQQFTLNDGSALLVGTQEWLTPDGQFIRGNGIHPNIVVPLAKNGTELTPTIENENNMSEQQILQGGDAQLNAAIQYLKQQK
jgi:carboxyl-terminal processing protease